MDARKKQFREIRGGGRCKYVIIRGCQIYEQERRIRLKQRGRQIETRKKDVYRWGTERGIHIGKRKKGRQIKGMRERGEHIEGEQREVYIKEKEKGKEMSALLV